MKTPFIYIKIFIFLMFISFQLEAKEFLVMTDGDYNSSFVDLAELDDKDSFENEFIKVVYNKDDEAISTKTTNHLLKTKAATVFYHLSLARKYFKNLMKDDFPDFIAPLIVRIDIKEVYDKDTKYKENPAKYAYNTALSIPPSHSRAKSKWGHEIWLRPAKFKFDKLTSNALVEQGLSIYDVLITSSHYIDSLKIIDKVIKDQTKGIDKDISLLAEGFVQDKAKRLALEWVLNKLNYGMSYLESALTAEVIYHEYTHIIFSPYIPIRSPLNLGEGIASFFATDISGGQDIATDTTRYSFVAGKKSYTELSYNPSFEHEKYAQQDFTYSLFYQMGEILNEDFKDEMTSGEYFWSLIKDLDVLYPLKVYPDFTDRIVSQCQKLCRNRFTSKIKLNNLMDTMGMID